MSGEANWGIDIPNPDVLNYFINLKPKIKSESYKILKDLEKLFNKFGTGPHLCTNGLYKIHNHEVKGEELYMKIHFDNAEKKIRITGFDIYKI